MIDVPAALRQAATLTFEELGFLYVAPELEDVNREAPLAVRATVAFTGPLTGRMEVEVSPALFTALAENMLGDDEPPTERQQRDALGEIANVVCGNALPGLAGRQAVFRLQAPVVCDVPPGATAAAPGAEVDLAVEDGRARIRLFTN